jgi:hypothetical protein
MYSIPQTAKTPEVEPPWERHFTVGQLSAYWGYGRTTIRRWFENEEGVLREGESRLRRHSKRPYVSLRIPESVAVRVYRRHTEAT